MGATTTSTTDGVSHEVELGQEGSPTETVGLAGILVPAVVRGHVAELSVEGPGGNFTRNIWPALDNLIVHFKSNRLLIKLCINQNLI